MKDIFQHIPEIDENGAAETAFRIFGKKLIMGPLPGERDKNFLARSESDEFFVLKVANATEDRDMLECQNMAMSHILKKNTDPDGDIPPCPEVVLSKSGDSISVLEGKQDTRYFVRLLTYIEGRPLALVNPHSHHLMESLGRFMGKIDSALLDFDNPAAHRNFHWDLFKAESVIGEHLSKLRDDAHRDIVELFLSRYISNTLPKIGDLRKSVIHNDANDFNVIVTPEEKWDHSVSGIIDFGDMVYSQTINELAITCAYAMMNKVEPMAVAERVVSGYHSVFPITEGEIGVLFDLICMRLCMSVCHSAHQSAKEPDNAYLRISEKPAWNLLNILKEINPIFAESLLRNACGLPASPKSSRIAAWLGKNQNAFARVIETDFSKNPPVMLDLEVDSPLTDIFQSEKEITAFSRHIMEKLDASNSKIGVGGYGEPRLIYPSDRYIVQTDEMPERRTIHLGLDIFTEANRRIFAFMDGKVFGIANHDAPFDYGTTIILEHATDDGDRFYTLYGHLSPDSLIDLEIGETICRGASLARIGEMNENGGFPPHLHFQIITEMFGYTDDFPGVVRPSRSRLWKQICPDPNLILNIPSSIIGKKRRKVDEILEVRKKRIGPNLSISYRKPLKIVRGKGPYLYNQDGQAFLDCVNNVCHVGHCHPHVVEAGRRQMGVLNTNTRYLHDNIIEYAERLLSKFPEPLSVCFFVCSGSEANELALRLARSYTDRRDIITLDGAYHGNTQGLIDISPYKHDGPGGKGAPPWVHKVAMPDGYRGPIKGTDESAGKAYAEYVAKAVEQMTADGPAAFICESILGCGGQVVLPDGYMREAFRHVRNAGGICIADEVQVGFGRVGTHFWAFETQDVVPDIVTLGKPIGNGHPLAAVITKPEIADAFNNGMEYFNTYGGNPVSCAIGMAVLDVIENEHLQENAKNVGALLLEGMKDLKDRYPIVGDARGLGLYTGLELVKNRETLEPATEQADYLVNRAKDFGMLLSTDGPLENIIKMKPPIVFSRKNAEDLIRVLDLVLSEDVMQVSGQ